MSWNACSKSGWIIPLLISFVLLATSCSDPEPPRYLNATMLPEARAIADFSLLDQDNTPFTLANLQGHWTFAFFGYTHCPDVCPNALALLGSVQRELEHKLDPQEMPQVVFVTVDPERDTAELLKNFVPWFHESFTGVTGEPEQINRLARQLGILFMRADDGGKDDYLVDHSAAIILFNPQGQFQAVFGMPHDVQTIQTDFLAIKRYYEATR